MDILNLRALTFNPTSAAIALGTTTTTNVAAASKHIIQGKFGTPVASSATTATPTTDAVTGLGFVPLAANQATVLVWGANAAGALKLAQGTIENTQVGVTTTAGAFINAPQFPSLPDDFCPLAYTLVRTSPTGSAFTAGTTAWAASGITTMVPVNVAVLPDRPQLS